MHTQDWITKGKGCNHSARLCTHIRVIVDFHEIKREEKRETKSSFPDDSLENVLRKNPFRFFWNLE